MIALVNVSEVPGFLERIKESYEPYKSLSEEKLQENAFATLPGSGAGSESWSNYDRTLDRSFADLPVYHVDGKII